MLKRNSSRALRIDDGDGIPIIIGAISYAQTPYLSATLDDQKTRGKERERIVPDTLPSRDTSRDAGRALIVRYCTLGAGKACQKCTREKKTRTFSRNNLSALSLVLSRASASLRDTMQNPYRSKHWSNIVAILKQYCNFAAILE